jgi:hypothetical protein
VRPLSLSSPCCPALSDAAIPRYQPVDRNHGGLAPAGNRLRLGHRADFRDHPLYDRGSLEVAGAVAREYAGFQGGIGRSPPPGGFSGPRCRGARASRFRRRGRGDRGKNDPASSACVCREGDRSPKEAKTLWAAIKAEEKSAINAALRETGGADGEHVSKLRPAAFSTMFSSPCPA